ncbi:hypothetical protein [Pseudomonas syringae group genomosp. 7]|uniref:hypothetical protein n=1 Tax=Pseudomonas syringae group genomosp. 7 TaxID=251699 RepID=UPI0037700408
MGLVFWGGGARGVWGGVVGGDVVWGCGVVLVGVWVFGFVVVVLCCGGCGCGGLVCCCCLLFLFCLVCFGFFFVLCCVVWGLCGFFGCVFLCVGVGCGCVGGLGWVVVFVVCCFGFFFLCCSVVLLWGLVGFVWWVVVWGVVVWVEVVMQVGA